MQNYLKHINFSPLGNVIFSSTSKHLFFILGIVGIAFHSFFSIWVWLKQRQQSHHKQRLEPLLPLAWARPRLYILLAEVSFASSCVFKSSAPSKGVCFSVWLCSRIFNNVLI